MMLIHILVMNQNERDVPQLLKCSQKVTKGRRVGTMQNTFSFKDRLLLLPFG